MAERSSRVVAFVLAAALLAGLGLRLYGLDRTTLTHPEFWVPRLDVPEYVSHPPPRHTARAVITQSFYPDSHPPGYHLLMLAWNSAGTGLFWIRLSSVVAGVLALLGMYLFTKEAFGIGVGAASTAMLAVHGYHIFWSQQARPWTLVSALALLTAYILLRLVHDWRERTAVIYTLMAAVGLWVDYYFWPIFAGQLLWTACRHVG